MCERSMTEQHFRLLPFHKLLPLPSNMVRTENQREKGFTRSQSPQSHPISIPPVLAILGNQCSVCNRPTADPLPTHSTSPQGQGHLSPTLMEPYPQRSETHAIPSSDLCFHLPWSLKHLIQLIQPSLLAFPLITLLRPFKTSPLALTGSSCGAFSVCSLQGRLGLSTLSPLPQCILALRGCGSRVTPDRSRISPSSTGDGPQSYKSQLWGGLSSLKCVWRKPSFCEDRVHLCKAAGTQSWVCWSRWEGDVRGQNNLWK